MAVDLPRHRRARRAGDVGQQPVSQGRVGEEGSRTSSASSRERTWSTARSRVVRASAALRSGGRPEIATERPSSTRTPRRPPAGDRHHGTDVGAAGSRLRRRLGDGLGRRRVLGLGSVRPARLVRGAGEGRQLLGRQGHGLAPLRLGVVEVPAQLPLQIRASDELVGPLLDPLPVLRRHRPDQHPDLIPDLVPLVSPQAAVVELPEEVEHAHRLGAAGADLLRRVLVADERFLDAEVLEPGRVAGDLGEHARRSRSRWRCGAPRPARRRRRTP